MVITRRLCSFGLALVIAASSLFPAAAWTKDSFISGGEEYEPSADVAVSDIYAAPRRARMVKVSAADQAAAETNTTGKLVVPATLPTSVDGTFQVMSKYRFDSETPPNYKFDYWRDVIYTCVPAPFISGANSTIYLVNSSFKYEAHSPGSNEMVRGLAIYCNKDKTVFPMGGGSTVPGDMDVGDYSWSYTVNYDVSSFSSSAFSLDGILGSSLSIGGPYWPNWTDSPCLSVDVLVDGQQVLSLSRGSARSIDFGGYVFSGSRSVSIISFCFHMPFISFVDDDVKYDGNYQCDLRYEFDDTLVISFLDGQDVINAQNNKTKDDINKHEEYESQWTGSMTENFNKLDVGNFTFHSGLIAGFALVSGIFMDIWNAMGNAAVVYVFPLTLGVVLMLLGRIGRTGGKRGSEDGEDTS